MMLRLSPKRGATASAPLEVGLDLIHDEARADAQRVRVVRAEPRGEARKFGAVRQRDHQYERPVAGDVVALDHVGGRTNPALELLDRRDTLTLEQYLHQEEGSFADSCGIDVHRKPSDYTLLAQRLAAPVYRRNG